MNLFYLFLVFLLIALTAFFVISEFSIIRVRNSRIDQLIEENMAGAKAVKRIVAHLDEYLSACQLGITITSLGLGWLGEPTVEELLNPIPIYLGTSETISFVISSVIAFAIITFLHVVAGELAPKTIAIQKAEKVSLRIAKPLIFFYKMLFPFIWILNQSSRFLTKMVGFQPVSENEIAHSEEELRIILSKSYERGEINQSEYKYVNRIFEFDNRIAKEIMVPRTDMVTLSKDASLAEIIKTVQEKGYTRYPVIDGDKDNIMGIVNIKEFLTDCILKKCNGDNPLKAYIKPVTYVIETIFVHELLVMMQKSRTHMVILGDEYGGTSGLVTVEDILEEIVGEIRDEFDEDELPLIQEIEKGHYILDAKLLIREVNDLLGIHLAEGDVDTIGGWLLTQKFDLKQGDTIHQEGYSFMIRNMDGYHIRYIEVKRKQEPHQNNPGSK